MSKVLNILFNAGGLTSRHDDDTVDRLTGRYSTTVLLTMCIIVTTTTFVGNPIECWCPAQFTGTHSSYANAKCLISPTYYVPFDRDLPKPEEPTAMINYYVWVPFILLLQALLCSLPGLIWKGCYRAAGLNIPSIIERLQNSQNLGWENRESAVKYVVQHLTRYSQGYCRPNYRRLSFCCSSRNKQQSGNYLACCYLATKFLYLIVCLGQFVLLSFFLGNDFHEFGLDKLKRLASGDVGWPETQRFPRVTICKFQIRHMNQVHPYVLQCVLPINLFNESIFLFIWFWLALMSLVTFFNLISWAYKILLWPSQVAHLRNRLYYEEKSTSPKDFKNTLQEFATKKLRRDSIFLLRLVGHNVGSLTESEVIHGLWGGYYDATIVPTCPPNDQETGNGNLPTLRDIVPLVET